jgi:hypothetical protein
VTVSPFAAFETAASMVLHGAFLVQALASEPLGETYSVVDDELAPASVAIDRNAATAAVRTVGNRCVRRVGRPAKERGKEVLLSSGLPISQS